MTLIERLTTGRSFVMKEFGKTDIKVLNTEAEVQKVQESSAHIIASPDFLGTSAADMREVIMTVFGSKTWNNTRCYLKVILDDYELWWMWLRLFAMVKEGSILDDPQALKLKKYNANRGNMCVSQYLY